MTNKKNTHRLTEPEIRELAKIAFANVLDFARFNPDGRVEIFDWEKVKEIGAKVSVVTRKVGRGKNAKEVKEIEIVMPDKLPALLKLLDHVSPPGRKSATSN
jgi:hypothetical protein